MKRFVAVLLTISLFLLISCKKESSGGADNDNEATENTGRLLSRVNIIYANGTKDSVIFKYAGGKLIYYNNRGEIIDSLIYDSQDRLIAFRGQQSRFNGKIVRMSVNYFTNDSILRTKKLDGDSSSILFKINKNQLNRWVLNNKQYTDTILYTYDTDEGLVTELENVYTNVDLQHVFRNVDYTYSATVLNPYNSGGNSLFWALLYDVPHQGAKKMFVQIQTIEGPDRANYNVNESYNVTDTSTDKYPLRLIYKRNNVTETWQFVYTDK